MENGITTQVRRMRMQYSDAKTWWRWCKDSVLYCLYEDSVLHCLCKVSVMLDLGLGAVLLELGGMQHQSLGIACYEDSAHWLEEEFRVLYYILRCYC